MAAVTIVVDSVTKVYQPVRAKGQPTQALAPVSFEVRAGEIVGIVGPSGCGKTTMLNMIGGLDRPSTGRILLDGVEVNGPGRDRVVAFQQPVLYPWLNVRGNVGFGLKIGRNVSKAEADHRIANAIALTGLQGFEHHAPYQLSGGMQQRVAIARAIVVDPKILLLDEPFGALDAQTRSTMQAFLLDVLARLTTTALFVTHDIDEAILLSDRVLVMTPRPGTIATTIEIPLERPRIWDMLLSQSALELKRYVVDVLRRNTAAGDARSQGMPGRAADQ